MKIPLIPVHVVTSKTLEAKLRSAKDKGIAEGKQYNQTQIRKLLSSNATGPVRLRGRKKKGS